MSYLQGGCCKKTSFPKIGSNWINVEEKRGPRSKIWQGESVAKPRIHLWGILISTLVQLLTWIAIHMILFRNDMIFHSIDWNNKTTWQFAWNTEFINLLGWLIDIGFFFYIYIYIYAEYIAHKGFVMFQILMLTSDHLFTSTLNNRSFIKIEFCIPGVFSSRIITSYEASWIVQ